jgi:hypothetical protein
VQQQQQQDKEVQNTDIVNANNSLIIADTLANEREITVWNIEWFPRRITGRFILSELSFLPH